MSLFWFRLLSSSSAAQRHHVSHEDWSCQEPSGGLFCLSLMNGPEPTFLMSNLRSDPGTSWILMSLQSITNCLTYKWLLLQRSFIWADTNHLTFLLLPLLLSLCLDFQFTLSHFTLFWGKGGGRGPEGNDVWDRRTPQGQTRWPIWSPLWHSSHYSCQYLCGFKVLVGLSWGERDCPVACLSGFSGLQVSSF